MSGARPKPQCATAFAFLRERLGKGALAPCTGQDYRALAAWFHLVEVWRTADERGELAALRALAHTLDAMQRSVWAFAKAGIPACGDWGDEDRLWQLVHAQRERGPL